MHDVLTVENMHVRFGAHAAPAVNDVSLALRRGRVTAIIGESGSGKSTVAMAILGLLPITAHSTGNLTFHGSHVTAANGLAQWRGRGISTVFQDPATALDPVFNIGHQLCEALRVGHPHLTTTKQVAMASALLAEVGISDPAKRMKDFPHQFSGGQQQRIMIAIALAGDPEVLIADEPTTALDVTVQRDILTMIATLVRNRNMALLLITHDMGVVAHMADDIIVMKSGQALEINDAHSVLHDPQSDYTKKLLRASAPQPSPKPLAPSETVLSISNLSIGYTQPFRAPKRIVDGITFNIRQGETLGLIGESGSGKSTTGRALVGLSHILSGNIIFDNTDLRALRGSGLRRARAKIGYVFQNPSGALNPKLTIAQILAEPLLAHDRGSAISYENRISDLLQKVELPQGFANRHPHQLSGGQKQRVALARALALGPQLLIADEPTSALDVSVQAEILGLLRQIQSDTGLACLFISHDLNVVRGLCHRIAIMQSGKIVETGDSHAIFTAPKHAYTRQLVHSVFAIQ